MWCSMIKKNPKHLVEAQEEKLSLRKEKEILLLETDMAAADAKIQVLMEELTQREVALDGVGWKAFLFWKG